MSEETSEYLPSELAVTQTAEEARARVEYERGWAYRQTVDPITAEIGRMRDMGAPIADIEEAKARRAAAVDKVKADWPYAEPEPEKVVRVFSKLKLVHNCMQAGIWQEVKAWIVAQGYEDLFTSATEIREDNELFSKAFKSLKTEVRVSDEDAEGILAKSLQG